MEREEIFDCPYPFGHYLKSLTANIVVLFDEKLEILDCNERFTDLSKYGREEIKGRQLDHLLVTEESELTDLPDVDSTKTVDVQLSDLFSQKHDYFFTSYVFNTGDLYCLIGEERMEDREVLEKISLLNNALSNKTRELSKKNKRLQKAKKKIEKLSRTDDLTGLANRRHFMEYFEKTMAQARRHSNPLSLAMIDLDEFKKINDTYGHKVGDDVLAAVGSLLKEQTREEDLAARIGGEEFVVVLAQSDQAQALQYAERIRIKINTLEIESLSEKVSASLGVSTMNTGDGPEALLKRADRALYRAKGSGRNTVYSPSG